MLARLMSIAIVAAVLGGCAVEPEDTRSPLIHVQRMAGPLNTQRLQIVLSGTAQAALNQLAEKKKEYEVWGLQGGSEVDPANLTHGLQRLLGNRFQSVRFSNSVGEGRGITDMTVLVDASVQFGFMSGMTNTAALSLNFLDREGRVIELVAGTGTSTIPFPAWDLRFRPALERALLQVALGIDRSGALASAASAQAPAVAQSQSSGAAAFVPQSRGIAEGAFGGLRRQYSDGLGLFASSIDDALAGDLGLARRDGLLVLTVARGGPADRAGIQPGDIVTELAPQALWSEGGRSGTVRLVRNGTPLALNAVSESGTANIAIWTRPPATRTPSIVTVNPSGGASFRTVTAALHRAVPGDTIMLTPGEYTEAALVPNGVKIGATDPALARIRSDEPWLVHGGGAATLSGLSFAGGWLGVEKNTHATIEGCEFELTGKQTAILVSDGKATVSRSTFRGSPEGVGINAAGGEVIVKDSVFSDHGVAAILLSRGVRAEISKNLMTSNTTGVNAADSELMASGNIVTGRWTPDRKDEKNNDGFWLRNATASLSKNAIRRHRYGIFVSQAKGIAKLTENTISQTEYAVLLVETSANVSDSLILQNSADGIYSTGKEGAPSRYDVTLLRNTISENRAGIALNGVHGVSARENLIEANSTGIRLTKSSANIHNNTIVLQRGSGLVASAGSDADVQNNIVAFNAFGLFLDVTAKRTLGYNNVYGNLASKEFPLLDGNYGRIDRYTTLDGRKVTIEVYPAEDLKAPTDFSLDPKFANLGSDYTLTAGSEFASAVAKLRRPVGAYAAQPR